MSWAWMDGGEAGPFTLVAGLGSARVLRAEREPAPLPWPAQGTKASLWGTGEKRGLLSGQLRFQAWARGPCTASWSPLLAAVAR